jgi:hypothetical protein
LLDVCCDNSWLTATYGSYFDKGNIWLHDFNHTFLKKSIAHFKNFLSTIDGITREMGKKNERAKPGFEPESVNKIHIREAHYAMGQNLRALVSKNYIR